MNTPPIAFTITTEESLKPLADVVRAHLGPAADAPLAHGGVWLNGRRVADAAIYAEPGATIMIRTPPTGRYAKIDINEEDILYEDASLLALNKRAGWYCADTPWDTCGTVLVALERFLEAREGLAPALHLAHRLDRDTTGVLLVSRDGKANGPLQAAFAGRAVRKEYLCVCAGVPAERRFSLHTGHGRGAGGGFRVYPFEQVGQVLPGGSKVKEAHTDFTLLDELPEAALLLAEPRTGRSHQIRLHAAALGHPLLGDARYGGPTHYLGRALPFHLLHAARLELLHPITGASLVVEAPMPGYFAAIAMP